MSYKNTSWNMIKLATWMFVCGKYVDVCAFLKTWMPFLVMLTIILCVIFIPNYS